MFENLLLSRIVEIGNQGPITSDPDGNADWNEKITLEIGPHPELSPTQRRAIANVYGMLEGKVHILVRRALLFFALRRLGLDTHPVARRPQDQQIVPVNKDLSDRTDLTPSSREGTPSAVAYD